MNRRRYAWLAAALLVSAAIVAAGSGYPLDRLFKSGFNNARPVADAGVDRYATIGVPTALSGVGVDLDNEPLLLRWQIVAQPAGSAVALSDVNSPTPSFTPSHLGEYRFGLVATDGEMPSALDEQLVTVIAQVLPPVADAGDALTVRRGKPVSLDGSGSSDPQARPLGYAWTLVLQPDGSAAALTGANTATPQFAPEVAGLYRAQLVVNNGSHDSEPSLVDVVALAPPPSETASAIDPTEVTPVGASTQFLYTGPDAVQTGVAPDAIDAERAAVLRGRAVDRDGFAIAGATVRVLGRPEFGETLTQEDGQFDLAVDGGARLVVEFSRDGLLTVQRRVGAEWNGARRLDDVMMLAPDPAATRVNLDRASGISVVRGSAVDDGDGLRRGTLLVPPSLRAHMRTRDGQRRALSGTATFRITDYTDKRYGTRAMPGELPPTTSFTYAAELSLDEALAARATRVDFDQPIPFYIENFREFPVGGVVPFAYYDRETAEWVPAANGRVVKILSIAAGQATLDVTGAGTPATPAQLAELGIDEAELTQLATLYPAGRSLWRTRVDHFTPWDCNWPRVPPAGAAPPRLPAPVVGANPARTSPDRPAGQEAPGECASAPGSVIQCQKQTMQKALPVAGTPYALHYSTERTAGWQANNTIEIPLTGAVVPPGLKGVELEIRIAGRAMAQAFGTAPNQTHTFPWDGLDAYGRRLSGSQEAQVRVGYTYDALYSQPGAFAQAFSTLSGVPITGNRARNDITLWQEFRFTVGAPLVAQVFGIGGWSLTPHHFYDPNRRTLFQGDGELREAAALVTDFSVSRYAGAAGGFGGDGGPALAAALDNPRGIAIGADGSVYVADSYNHRIRRISRDGTIATVAGGGATLGDGGPAVAARLYAPTDVAVARDGSLYIADSYQHRVRKVAPDGTIATIAGDGIEGYAGDGGPATAARLAYPSGVALGPYGDVYVADTFNHRIRRIGADGIVTTTAGTGVAGYNGDAQPAIQAQLQYPLYLDVSADGEQYIVDNVNHRIRKVDTGGVIATAVGNGTQGSAGDGGAATAAQLAFPRGVALLADGTLLVVDGSNRRVRRVDGEGTISTLIGGGTGVDDGSLGLQYRLQFPSGVAVGPDGRVVASDTGAQRLVVGARFLPQYSSDELVVASNDGLELYRFGATGRHLATIDTLTRATVFRFEYDEAGRLVAIVDADGDRTTIERNAAGVALAIVGPFGHRTALGIVAGQLASVTNPNDETDTFVYGAGGLVTTATDARLHASTYAYDARGRLLTAADAALGGVTLARTASAGSYTVTRTSALNRATRYDVTTNADGSQTRKSTFPDGTYTQSLAARDGKYASTLPDNTEQTHRVAGDPRFGLQSAYAASSETKTGGRTLRIATRRQATLATANDPLSLTSLVETATVNGRTGTNTYDAAARTWTQRTPLARTSTTTLDALGRPVRVATPGLADTVMTYDAHGRLDTVVAGSGADERRVRYGYGADGHLASVTNAVDETVTFARDAVGRVKSITRPDLAVTLFDYDAAGNLVGVTPPGRPAHTFEHTPVDLVARYRPPVVAGSGANDTVYGYNRDRQATTVTRADNRQPIYGYDAFGRLDTLTIARGTFTLSYLPATGQVSRIVAPGGLNLDYGYSGALTTSVAWTGGARVDYGYDDDLRVASIGVKGNSGATQTISLGYDDDGLVVTAGALSLDYDDANAQLTSTTLGATSDAYTYNAFGEVASYTAKHGTTTLFAETYTRDRLGRIAAKTTTIGAVSHAYDYAYDAAGRLREVKTDGVVTATYAYDANGNRQPGTYDAQDRMLAYGGATYTYTADGELATRVVAGQTTTYDYDELGNLLSVVKPGSPTIAYRVDAQNRRIGRLVNGVLSQGFVYQDQLRPAAELTSSGTIAARFVYAEKVSTPSYMVKSGQTYRFVTDQIGSVRLVVDTTSGAVAQQLDYDAFGNVTLDTNPGFQPFGFAGGLYDRDTGLVRFGARDYDAGVGRWTSKDPQGFSGGTNLYSYAEEDPQNVVDPTGNCPACVGAVVGFVVDLTIQLATTGCIDGRQLLLATALGAVGSLAGGPGLVYFMKGLPNSVKGKIGETLSYAKNRMIGSRIKDPSALIKKKRLTTIVDSAWKTKSGTYFVESKFGSAKLTGPQRAAAKKLKDAYHVERWGYPFFERLGNYGGGVAGAEAADHP